MYYYRFSEDITDNSVQKLIDDTIMYEYVTLHFSTSGGEYTGILMLIDYLNLRKDSIFIVFDNILFSAGFILLTRIKNDYTFSESFEAAIFHKIDALMHSFRDDGYTKERKKIISKNNQRLLQSVSHLPFNKKQLKIFSKGKNVILYKKDLIKLGLWKEQDNPLKKKWLDQLEMANMLNNLNNVMQDE